MEKSNFVIQLMSIPLDAALFDAQEMCEEFSIGNNLLYTMSTSLPIQARSAGVFVQHSTGRVAGKTRIFRCR